MAKAPTAVSQQPPTEKSWKASGSSITGGTGSLGKVLLRRILGGDAGTPTQIIVLSRDEAKQHEMRVEYQQRYAATDEVIYRNFRDTAEFRIGDVRDYASVCAALHGVDIVFNAAALKQVPTCEYFPYEAVLTNIIGPENIVRAIRDLQLPVEVVVGISTDKACKPVNVMGMTKSIQERIFARANLELPHTRIVIVRYGNVLASRGSVIPLFHEQIRTGGPVTITHPDMTRFLLSLDDAVDLIFAAVRGAQARRDLYSARSRRAHGRRRRRPDRRPADQDRRHRHPPGREAARDPDLGGRGASHGAAGPALRDRADPAGAARGRAAAARARSRVLVGRRPVVA